MRLKRLRPTNDPEEFFVGDSEEEKVRGIKVHAHPTKYSKELVCSANFLIDKVDDLVVEGVVPYGAVIGFFYENYNRDNEVKVLPDQLLVRFVRRIPE